MKHLIVLVLVGLVLTEKIQHAFLSDPQSILEIGVNGGYPCLICTFLVALIEQLAIVHGDSVDSTLKRVCDHLPHGIYRKACFESVDMFGPAIVDAIYAKESPDVICHLFRICRTDTGQPECHLYPSQKGPISERVEMLHVRMDDSNIKFKMVGTDICDHLAFKGICNYLKRIFDDHEPAIDFDRDGFSTFKSLRGSSWKGKDCRDYIPSMYPGTKPLKNDLVYDSNCNGIYGRSSNSSLSYEETFCKNSSQLGVAVLGDSISAHFHLPDEWIDATKFSYEAFADFAFIVENELDWPQLSAITGFMNSTWPVAQGVTRSIYHNLWQRNKCNFRDFQNVGVNGADSNSILSHITKGLTRNQQKDQPMLVILSLLGNDVCNRFPDTVSHMTPDEVFRQNIINILKHLDTKLPNGSHVLLTSLANGSFIYDIMEDRTYVLGKVKNDLKYKDFFQFMSCLQISPCNGWLTPNDTLRELTTKYATKLSDIIKTLSTTLIFNNFDIGYTEFPLDEVIEQWKAKGGELWELFELVDGFHSSQLAHELAAGELWDIITAEHPDWIGDENPYNPEITRLFGDQGGYF